MHQAQAIQAMVSDPQLRATMQKVAGPFALISCKISANDVKQVARWMEKHYLSLSSLYRDDLVAYQAHLAHLYTVSTATRMWTVARRWLEEMVPA